MTTIKAFNGFIYNQEKVEDISKVGCPPYDVISPKRQDYFHELSPYNFIRLILGKDIAGEDKYERSAKLLEDWISKHILINEKKEALYFYRQVYKVRGESKSRDGLIGLLKIEDKDSCVFGHEHTRLEPKEDRLKLINATAANLSPIFALFPDRKRIISLISQKYLRNLPLLFELTDDELVKHALWRIDEPELLAKITQDMKGENFFIADGHHRYEVACIYREQIRKKYNGLTGNEDCNFLMSYFTNTEPRNLSVFPIHRLLKLNDPIDLDALLAKLKNYFDVEEVRDKEKFFFLLEKAGNAEHVLGMSTQKRLWLLRLKNIKLLDKFMSDKPPVYRKLDVAILNSLVFDRIMDISTADKEHLIYSHDAEEVLKEVDTHQHYLAFLLNPVKVKQIMEVATAGEKMPPKSTYFYPKVLSGLVINKHRG